MAKHMAKMAVAQEVSWAGLDRPAQRPGRQRHGRAAGAALFEAKEGTENPGGMMVFCGI